MHVCARSVTEPCAGREHAGTHVIGKTGVTSLVLQDGARRTAQGCTSREYAGVAPLTKGCDNLVL